MISSLTLLLLLQAVASDTAMVSQTDGAAVSSSVKACYVKRIVQKDQLAFDFQVIVPTEKSALAIQKGYAPVACSIDPERAAAFQDRMCALAALDDAVQARTIEVLGVAPREMCAKAKQLKATGGTE